MDKITDFTQVGMRSLTALTESIMSAFPNVIGALSLILLGWLVAKLISFLVQKTLKAIKFDKLSDKFDLNELFKGSDIEIAPSLIIGKFVYWVIMLLFFVTASDTLGWTVVSTSIGSLMAYLPKLFSGIVIFVIGFYIASMVRSGLKGILQSLGVASSRVISNFAYYIILIIISLTALNQAGVDTAIVTSNLTIIIGGAVLAFAISFGFGSRDILTNILSSFYSKNNFKAGQKIVMGDIKGRIEKIDITSCVIRTDAGLSIIIPVKRLLSEEVIVG